jgi:tetratricopeptide (TPR) repeat protein
MLKFFRKIRQNLLMENKTGKYFKYAIGEIVLVVIGILIALQINTWNENRKSKDIVKNYYVQILQDLSKEYINLNQDYLVYASNIALHNEFVKNLPNQKSPEAIIMSSIKLNYETSNIRFNTNTIETLQTTGDIKLIPIEIRNKLIDLRNFQNMLSKSRFDNNDFFSKEMGKASALGYNPNFIPLRGTAIAPNQLFKDLKIEDHYSEMALKVISAFVIKDFGEQYHLNSLTTMLEQINSLFTMINKELGSPNKDIESIAGRLKVLISLVQNGKTVDEIIAVVKEQDSVNPDYNISERSINALGYSYMNTLRQNSDALKVFKLNTELYPDAFNTHDSYGECLLLMGDTENAIKAYKKSLELNPRSESAIKVLSELKVEN